jgi:hypothetical protein
MHTPYRTARYTYVRMYVHAFDSDRRIHVTLSPRHKHVRICVKQKQATARAVDV